MATRIIRTKEDEILRKISKPVKKIDDNVKMLLDDMAETMIEKNGVGIAAVQVGVLKRIIVIDAPDGEEFIEGENTVIELINPEIIESSGEIVKNEGCLSIPGIAGTVARPEFVKVKALDRDGKELTVEAKGYRARAISHEIDHLNGVLFTDKVIEYDEDEE